jgi:hypothetical protein
LSPPSPNLSPRFAGGEEEKKKCNRRYVNVIALAGRGRERDAVDEAFH